MRYGVRIAPIETIQDLLASPQAAARGVFAEVNGPLGGHRLPGAFAQGMPHGFAELAAAPRLGEHTLELLDELRVVPLKEADA